MVDEHRERLVARFLDRLFRASPASVLDVGCGRGDLLRACSARGVQAQGLETSSEAVAAARESGCSCSLGDAADLTYEDGSFDWVTLRHVPHHLHDPQAALAEAWRVARTGVLVAEPWFDDSIESQRAARELDRFQKRLDRRRGRFHADVLSASELSAAFPPDATIVVEPYLPLAPLDEASFRIDLGDAALGAELEPQESEEAHGHRRTVAEGRVSRPGTLVLVATHGPAR